MFDLNFVLRLESKFCNTWPEAQIGLDNYILFDDFIKKEITLNFTKKLKNGQHSLWIKFFNKTNLDSTINEDKAIIIKEISFENISTSRFIWNGIYKPIYPEPWKTQQEKKDIILPDQLSNIDYLGFNGTWKLNFTTPIFTWIHKSENLGWIYE